MPINDWPVMERPREKLLKRGPVALSDAELLAIFLRTGTSGKTAVDLSRELLAGFGSLRALVECRVTEFCRGKGLGPSKYVQIQAAIELGKRYLESGLQETDVLTSPQSTREYLLAQLRAYPHEVFACLFLNNRHHIISFDKMFNGTIDGASVYPREVVKQALGHNAAAVIFAHNHPSGVAEPSSADISLTRRLKTALELVDIRVLDHFVIAANQAVSLAERGLI
ncbi:MAG TPA: DNA repair protein RadC [Gammaproteobacteria bacterium]|nr:DNA repair protein RadC [Gammaproteobacteria bacterium]